MSRRRRPGHWRGDLAERLREFRAQLTSPLFRNAYALMINTAATGLLGVVYWLLAARHYRRSTSAAHRPRTRR